MDQRRHPPEVLTVDEAADRLRVHPRTVFRMLECRELDAFKTARHGHWRIICDGDGLPRRPTPAAAA